MTTGNDARTGNDAAPKGGTVTGDGVATVVNLAAIKDAFLHVTAVGAFVKTTRPRPDLNATDESPRTKRRNHNHLDSLDNNKRDDTNHPAEETN